MRKLNYTGRQMMIKLEKCHGNPFLCNDISIALARQMEEDSEVSYFKCHVALSDVSYRLRDVKTDNQIYCTDFLVYFRDGHVGVRECCQRWEMKKKKIVKLLYLSRDYWRTYGITDWKLVTEREELFV